MPPLKKYLVHEGERVWRQLLAVGVSTRAERVADPQPPGPHQRQQLPVGVRERGLPGARRTRVPINGGGRVEAA